MSPYPEPDSADNDEILTAMERAAFALHEFEIPVGGGLTLPRIRRKRCACCGGKASRAVFDLRERKRRLLCEACQ
jgi:hypothetical protein